jgi:hypothetical protein
MRASRRGSAALVLGLLALVAAAGAHEDQGEAGGIGQSQAHAPIRAGTSGLAGTITAADTGLPIPHAVVTLLPQGRASEQRTALADVQGAFRFANLPAGTYSLRAEPGLSSGRYAGAFYARGADTTAATPVTLKDGEQFGGVHIALPRAGAIEGRVVDDVGEPVARVRVFPFRVARSGGTFALAGRGTETDDLGRFRLYGLEAAEYIVGSQAPSGGAGVPVTEGESESYALTYYPSVLADRDATRLRITPGAELAGIEIRLLRTRVFRITGAVVDSKGERVQRPPLALVPAASNHSASWTIEHGPDGRFAFRNVTPGDYWIVVRGGAPRPPGIPAPPGEYASLAVRLTGDIDDLLVVTSPGVAVSGRVVFAEGAPEKPLPVRLTVLGPDRVIPVGPPVAAGVDEEWRFTLREVFGPARLRLQQALQGYALESVRVDGRDITDEPFEFGASHAGQVEVVLTGRVGRLEGAVTDADRKPVKAVVIVLPDDNGLWLSGSSRIHTAVPPDGRFTFSVLPGSYLVAAVAEEDFRTRLDPSREFYEAIAKDATSVYLAEGETRTLNLTLLRRR